MRQSISYFSVTGKQGDFLEASVVSPNHLIHLPTAFLASLPRALSGMVFPLSGTEYTNRVPLTPGYRGNSGSSRR